MFTFVVWMVGLLILAWLAYIDFVLVVLAFSKHWFVGVLTTCLSLAVWGALALIFL